MNEAAYSGGNCRGCKGQRPSRAKKRDSANGEDKRQAAEFPRDPV